MINFKYAVFISTFVVFLLEGLFHYNVGKNGLTSFKFPELYDFIKILLILTFFSGINAYVSKFIFDYDKNKNT
jgi:hypothetical protein